MIKRILFFILVLVFACIGPVYVFLSAALLYSLYYVAYELIVITALIDVVFGTEGSLPYYTIFAIIWLLLITLLKPRLLVYDQ